MAGKRKILIGIILSVIIIILIITPFIMALLSSYTVLVRNSSGEFYTAEALFILGDSLICLKDESVYKKKKWAVADPDPEREFSVVPVSDISLIEILPDADTEEYSADSGVPEYFGTYKVDVSGNDGYLYLKLRNGRIYGSIRFPHWANGSFEPLKRLRIYKNGRISFIRSVESQEEANKVGVRTFFTQWFYGNYRKDGTEIHGDYTSRGAESAWKAYKIK